MGRTIGVGAAIRAAILEARSRGYDVIVIMAANDKDRPDEISRLLAPMYEQGFVVVCGSRYLPGGNFGNMPFYRQLATRFVHPLLMSLAVRRRLTDTTNGFPRLISRFSTTLRSTSTSRGSTNTSSSHTSCTRPSGLIIAAPRSQ